MKSCEFILAWIGKCGKDCVEGDSRCAEHTDIMCGVCKDNKAKYECDTTYGLVYGMPLCYDCACRWNH